MNSFNLNNSPDLTMVEITKKLFNNEFLSDVQIRVNDKVIHAHSLELLKRSEVFQHELQEMGPDRKMIPINDVMYDSVYKFIQFIYIDECIFQHGDAVDLLTLARRYEITKLANLITGSVVACHDQATVTKMLFNCKIPSNVELHVGPQVVYAHSLELMKRSVVFQKMLQGKVHRKIVLKISGVQYDSLYQFVRFLYTDECSITDAIIKDLIILAKRYEVIKLENLVIGFVTGCEMFLNMFEYCILTKDQLHLRRFQNAVLDTLHQCLETQRFLTLDPTAIEEILKFERINVSEFKLFESFARWLKQNAADNQIKTIDQRAHYRKLIRLIRFPAMTDEESLLCFQNHSHLFAVSDSRSYLRMMSKEMVSLNLVWNSNPRGKYEFGSEWLVYSKKEKFETKFSVTRDMCLIGIRYGNEANKADTRILISEHDVGTNKTSFVIVRCSAPPHWHTNVINLGESIRLKPNRNYAIKVEYCTAIKGKMKIRCRTETTKLFTNIPSELIKIKKEACRSLFDLFFKLSNSPI